MKIRHFVLTILALAIIVSSCGQKVPKTIKLETSLDSVSYALGVDVANSLKNGKVNEVNYQAFLKGMDEVFKGEETKIPQDKLKFIVNNYFMQIRNKENQKNYDDGQKFLEENKKREGVITTESGLQYEIITEGTGKKPAETSIVIAHYKGTLIDGTQFDSSYDRGEPLQIALNSVIKGWTEGLQLMKEGAKYKFYVPTDLGYGTNVRPGGPIQPNMALIFEVELIEVKENTN